MKMGKVGEVGDGMDGSGTSGMCYFINQIALLGENPMSSFSLSFEIEIKGLFSNPSVPQ